MPYVQTFWWRQGKSEKVHFKHFFWLSSFGIGYIKKELKNYCYCKLEIDFIVTHLYRLHFMKTRENFEKLEEEHGHFARTCMINLKEITKGISVMM